MTAINPIIDMTISNLDNVKIAIEVEKDFAPKSYSKFGTYWGWSEYGKPGICKI